MAADETHSRARRPPVLEIRGISKRFGSVQALTDVDFEVRDGEVMALVGDNGAGKSTLIKCIAGSTVRSGEVFFDGPPSHPRAEGRGAARDRGRLPGSRALRQPRRRPEHVPRPRGPRPAPAPQGAGHGVKTAETLKSLSVTTIRSIRQPVATLSGGQRQSVAVARAVHVELPRSSSSTSRPPPSASRRRVRSRPGPRLAEQGLAVVLISHNLHDIFEVATRITVLRLGRSIAVYERAK